MPSSIRLMHPVLHRVLQQIQPSLRKCRRQQARPLHIEDRIRLRVALRQHRSRLLRRERRRPASPASSPSLDSPQTSPPPRLVLVIADDGKPAIPARRHIIRMPLAFGSPRAQSPPRSIPARQNDPPAPRPRRSLPHLIHNPSPAGSRCESSAAAHGNSARLPPARSR